jgi:multisubunit Na+/H+ antiporter MnhB subunit
MKRSYRGVMLLSLILFLNIIFTQYTVNFYFYEKYALTVLFAVLNVILFPIAVYIYRKEVKVNER